MRRIHVYYIIFFINVMNLFFNLYYKKFLEITTIYKIKNIDEINLFINKALKNKNIKLDTGNINFILIVYCLMSFFIGWKYNRLKYFLFIILFIFEGLKFYYLDNLRVMVILGSIIFYILGSMLKKKTNTPEHEIYK